MVKYLTAGLLVLAGCAREGTATDRFYADCLYNCTYYESQHPVMMNAECVSDCIRARNLLIVADGGCYSMLELQDEEVKFDWDSDAIDDTLFKKALEEAKKNGQPSQ